MGPDRTEQTNMEKAILQIEKFELKQLRRIYFGSFTNARQRSRDAQAGRGGPEGSQVTRAKGRWAANADGSSTRGETGGRYIPRDLIGVPLGGGVITAMGPRWGLGLAVGICDPIFYPQSSPVRLCLA